MTASNVPDTLQRTALGENSDTQLDAPWHFNLLGSGIPGRLHNLSQLPCPAA